MSDTKNHPPEDPVKAHPSQAIDEEVPDGKWVNRKAFKALQDNYEGDPDE